MKRTEEAVKILMEKSGHKIHAIIAVLLVIEMIVLSYCALRVTGITGQNTTGTSSTSADFLLTAGPPDSGSAVSASFFLLAAQESYSTAIARVRPAIVSLKVEFDEDAIDSSSAPVAAVPAPAATAASDLKSRIGSGVILDTNGFIVTNHHVIAGARSVMVTVYSSSAESYRARVVKDDPDHDLAIIKIDTSNKLVKATLANSDKIEVGDVVMAIGSPFGLEQTVTLGIISDTRRTLNVDGEIYEDMIQTDAAVNHGNSGGGLINIKGEVIGINSAIYAPTGVFNGISFAIPVNRLKDLMDEVGLAQPGRDEI